ncbi:hypothetical protein ACA910_018767 [Epithemia clementina (nom. ined.)]
MSLLPPQDQRKAAYWNIARMCTETFIQALRQDGFPDSETETLFGVVLNDQEGDGLGDLIYQAWAGIYKHKQYTNGKKYNFDVPPPGVAPTSRLFEEEVTQALRSDQLPAMFQKWLEEAIDDPDYNLDGYCRRLQSRNLTFQGVIHPTNKEHGQWMKVFHKELGSASSAGGESFMDASLRPSDSDHNNSSGLDTFCQCCGQRGVTLRCSSCQEVFYCIKDHQKAHWKKHKIGCKAVAANPVSVWIQVEEGEGNGLVNAMVNHIFANKHEGFQFVRKSKQLQAPHISPPLRSPFCELMGWDVEIYCSTKYNRVLGGYHNGGELSVLGYGDNDDGAAKNGAGIYLGCDLGDGLTRYDNLAGPIFVTGRRQSDGQPLNQKILWGLLNVIWDAMDLYDGTCGDYDDDDEFDAAVRSTLQKWASSYQKGEWIPQGGFGGVNVYSTDFTIGDYVDHRK